MKKFSGLFLNGLNSIDGYRVSDDVVAKIIKDQPRVPVTIDFTGMPIGYTTRFLGTGTLVQCEFEVDETKYPFFHMAYIVPSFDNVQIVNEGRTKVIAEGDLNAAAVTLMPSNVKMTMIHEVNQPKETDLEDFLINERIKHLKGE